ncbi:universal stress protein [Natrialbaceae archaeon A-chndr2]
MYDRILFATDGSDHASTVAAHAIDIANTRDADLHVISVVDDRAFLVLDDDRVESVREELRAKALEAAEEAVTAATDVGVSTETIVDSGSPAECIVSYAEENDADLIVMGTSGDAYETNVVGSVSERVVRTAPAPVLTVGPETER